MLTCGNCKYWVRRDINRATANPGAKCKLHPPQAGNYRPTMSADDGCGQGVEKVIEPLIGSSDEGETQPPIDWFETWRPWTEDDDNGEMHNYD